MSRVSAGRWGGVALAVLLVCCAKGQQSNPTDGSPGGEGLHLDVNVNADLDAAGADARPDSAVVDVDGDGHCLPGAFDPNGLCQAFDDCDDTDKERYPGATEDCANLGVDNDCDGDADEVDLDHDDTNDLGQPCSTTLPGVCAAGTRACQGSSLSCVPTYQVGQLTETCNGEDDDCDSSTDEGELCQNGSTCAGAAGCQCEGGAPCAGSQQCCAGIGCVDLALSTTSCGACGVACGTAETCDGGKCRCGSTVGTVGGGPACTGSASCTGGACVTCDPQVNLALSAVASSSGGGSVAGYEPAQLNNDLLQASCKFHWITAGSTAGSAWIQLTWTTAVTFNHVWFDTTPASSGVCSMSAGRTLAGGTLQQWDGSKWVDLVTVAGKANDWSVTLAAKVTTTRVRLYGAHATTSGLAMNPMVFEWRVLCQ